MNLRERASDYGFNSLMGTEWHVNSQEYKAICRAFEAGFREAQAELERVTAERDALEARCDDRTDRWQVANEVAGHIRALAEGDEK